MHFEPFFVTNGQKTVGPVAPNTLLKGIAGGLVGEGCMVWQHPWTDWRALESVREVNAFLKARQRRPARWVPGKSWTPPPSASAARSLALVGTAQDEGEAVALTLRMALAELRADMALAHRPSHSLGELETRVAIGEQAQERLGEHVDRRDPAIALARFGARGIRRPWGRAAGIAAMERLRGSESELKGVLVAPLFVGGRLTAVIELGKIARSFRDADAKLIGDLLRAAASRMGHRRAYG